MQMFTGVIKGNTVLVDDKILPYDGYSAVVTVTEEEKKLKKKHFERIKQLVIPTELGNRADEYIRELRDNDRF